PEGARSVHQSLAIPAHGGRCRPHLVSCFDRRRQRRRGGRVGGGARRPHSRCRGSRHSGSRSHEGGRRSALQGGRARLPEAATLKLTFRLPAAPPLQLFRCATIYFVCCAFRVSAQSAPHSSSRCRLDLPRAPTPMSTSSSCSLSMFPFPWITRSSASRGMATLRLCG